MDTTDLTDPPFSLSARSCGLVVLVVGSAALVGWWTQKPFLLGIRASYIPMAPNTALAFIVLGAAFLAVGGGRAARMVAGVVATLVVLIAGLRLMETAAGVDLAVDRWFYRVPSTSVGLVDLGKMAPFSAVAFLASGIGLASVTFPFVRGRLGDLAGACGLVAGLTGLVFSLGYLFSPNAPLLYGTSSIPMALNTSFCFVVLGAGLVAASGPRAFPLHRLAGSSVRARLLRVFLPLVVGTVGVVAWLTHVVTASAGASTAAITSAALATAAIFLFGLICERIARRVGEQLDRAEGELRQARDELEVKVEERTADLSRSLSETRAAHQALQAAHRELKDAQCRMLQQAKMASLGQTAAGVAHEINNPLAFVTNNLAVLKREVTGLHDVLRLYQQSERTLAEYERVLHAQIVQLAEDVDLPFVLANLQGLLERSKGGLNRIQKIVEGLRDFAHLDEADFQEADLNAGISSTVDLMKTIAEGKEVALEADLAAIPRLVCFPAKLNLVLQSLLSNAIDASRPGGRVVVRTREAGPWIEITVDDAGSGIPDSIRDRVFDPFFTTKPVGQGTGLGLAISYGIIKDHAGTIDFESTPGQGTRFTIRLPAKGIPQACAVG